MTKKKLFAGAIAALFAVAVLWRLCFAQEEPTVDASPLAVHTQEAREQEIDVPVVFTGSIEGTQSAVVSSTASGRVVEILVEDGAQVAKGTPLFRLDATAAKNAVRAASSTVRQAQVKYDQAKSDFARQESLYEQGAVAVQQRDLARTQMLAAESELDAAGASLSDAQKQAADTCVVSPVDGFVANKKLTQGKILEAGSPALTVEQMGAVYVAFQVEQQYISVIEPGLPVQVTVDAYPGRVFDCTVEIVNPAADKENRMFLVKAHIANDDLALKPGMFVHASLQAGGATPAILVPKSCVEQKKGLSYVYVAEDGKARRVRVELGEDVGDNVMVTQGLETGSRVILDQIDRLQDGAAISAEEASE